MMPRCHHPLAQPTTIAQRAESSDVKYFSSHLAVLATLFLVLAVFPLHGQQSAMADSPPILPDPKMTPGDTLDVTLADIQVKGYSSKVRNVPIEVKREVYASYGIQHWNKGEYEVDHLIPLSIGGSNSKKNLWPESYLTEPWNAHTKDQLEYKLLKLVRAGQVDLHTAQLDVAHDWIAAYKKYVGSKPGATGHRGVRHPKGTAHFAKDTSGLRDEDPDMDSAPISVPVASTTPTPIMTGQVWVNTKSGVIWKPGSKYYGNTKEGKYMSEADALAAGYHDEK